MSKKTQLLNQLAGKNRGLLASEGDKVNILSAIAELEAENRTPNPIERTELLGGNWRLLYTTSKDLLSFDRFPILQTGQIYQCIIPEKSKVYNLAEVVGIPFLEVIVSVVAEFTPVSEKRVNVNFKRSIVGLQKLLGYKSPDAYIEEVEKGKKFPPLDFPIERNSDQKAWLEITYLDEDLRISRGNRGSVFVLSKV
ncbi:PAP/fibrillin family protein [Dactylococcopsis salina]|uniref:PAP_fibrillin n=1 Tax=Dactylococcopsis salina (strain PCC 8305) TaxID=13035 RepID=K9YYQ9_DACS8|nr:PAP/fibrillin family protein [Dactylococcopsis salina]AFZ52086.1 PAP_fibrillin [Dactylococcopsis salina PCC 8305]